MAIRILPDSLINQIAAGEVVERPASVVKELVENALDAGATQIVVDVADGGRTLISVIDDGGGMTRPDLENCIMRHATSKLPSDDLLNINFMGFRGEALPSIASVGDMTIDTFNSAEPHGWRLDCTTGAVRPSDWDGGTRVRVTNLFSRTPARLKFLRGDRAEMMAVVDVVKRLAMSRPDTGFVLNNKWYFPKNQDFNERIVAVMGDDVRGRMVHLDVQSESDPDMKLWGVISEPTLRRASSVDQYLFVNGRAVKDKVLVGALRAAYMDVMHAREFPLCALYLTLNPRKVDVNVSPAKTEVHFLEPSHVRGFIIKSLRAALARTMMESGADSGAGVSIQNMSRVTNFAPSKSVVCTHHRGPDSAFMFVASPHKSSINNDTDAVDAGGPGDCASSGFNATDLPLGRVIGQIGNKYILAQSGENLVIVDQHAAHERITYEKLRRHAIKGQPLLTPIVVSLRGEDVNAVLAVADEMRAMGLHVDAFGDSALAIFEKPADWDFDWGQLFHNIADEVRAYGHSSQLAERMHLKLANYACHHSVRAGQKLDVAQMDALLREIENTTRGGECNHGRPVYKFIPISEFDSWFERI